MTDITADTFTRPEPMRARLARHTRLIVGTALAAGVLATGGAVIADHAGASATAITWPWHDQVMGSTIEGTRVSVASWVGSDQAVPTHAFLFQVAQADGMSGADVTARGVIFSTRAAAPETLVIGNVPVADGTARAWVVADRSDPLWSQGLSTQSPVWQQDAPGIWSYGVNPTVAQEAVTMVQAGASWPD